MAIELGVGYLSILPSTDKLAPAIRREMGVIEQQSGTGGERSGKAFGSRFTSSLARWSKRGLLSGAVGVGLLGAAGLKTAAALEQSQIGFETMLGSEKKANAFLNQIKKTAAATPFELPGLTQSAQKMLAFGFAAKDVIPTLTTLGDAAAGLGAGQEGLDRIVLSIGQMKAKGKVQSDELLQLTESGVPALKILANGFKVSTAEMQNMVTKGLVPADKAIPLLLTGLKKGTKGQAGETAKFGGLMAKQSQSLSGLFSTLKDTVMVGLAGAIEPLLPMIKSGLTSAINGLGPALAKAGKGLSTFVKGMHDGTGAGGKFAAIVSTLWSALSSAVSVGLTVTSFLAKHKPLVYGLAAAYLVLKGAILAHAAAQKVSKAGGIIAYLADYAKKTKIVTFATKAWAAAQWLFNAAMEANPLVLLITGLVLLGAALFVAWKKSDTFRAIVTAAFNGIKAAGVAVLGWLTGAISATVGFVRDHWKLLVAILGGPIAAAAILVISNFDRIKQAGSDVIGWVKSIPSKLGALAGKFGAAGKSLIHAFVGGMKNAAGVIGGIAGNIWSGVKKMLNAAITKINNAIPNKIGKGKFSINLPDSPFPAFAKGTLSAPGGVALVGEEGPELVNLPRGSQVVPNGQLASTARQIHAAAPTSVTASTPKAASSRTEFVITNWKHGEGYFREIAEDTINGEDGFAGTKRRMN